jgi:hypothetical protein
MIRRDRRCRRTTEFVVNGVPRIWHGCKKPRPVSAGKAKEKVLTLLEACSENAHYKFFKLKNELFIVVAGT